MPVTKSKKRTSEILIAQKCRFKRQRRMWRMMRTWQTCRSGWRVRSRIRTLLQVWVILLQRRAPGMALERALGKEERDVWQRD